MKWWPLVWRERAEHAERMAEFYRRGNETMLGWYNAERAKNEALNERLLSLKMVGAVEPPKQTISGLVAGVALAQAKPDELRDLIDSKSGGNLRKRGMMLKQLAQDRADGMDPEKIAQRIEQGVSSDGVPS